MPDVTCLITGPVVTPNGIALPWAQMTIVRVPNTIVGVGGTAVWPEVTTTTLSAGGAISIALKPGSYVGHGQTTQGEFTFPFVVDNVATAVFSDLLGQNPAVITPEIQAAAEAARDQARYYQDIAIGAGGAILTWPATAAGLGQGIAGVTSIVAGSGGTNGTFALAFTGGTQVLAPVGVFTVAGGLLVSVVITYKGYYSAGAPTLVFTASAGLTGASATVQMAANTPVNDNFTVPSTLSGEAAIFYRNVAGAATEVTRTPNAAAVKALTFFPALDLTVAAEVQAFGRIKKLQLFGANPALFYSVKFLFWKDVDSRINVTIVSHTDAIGTGAVEVCAFVLGTTAYTGPLELTLAAVGGSGVTGVIAFDFTDPTAMAVNNAPAAAATYTRRGLNPRIIASSAANSSVIGAQITAALVAEAALSTGLRIPFADTMATAYLRNIFKSFVLYGGNLAHDYIVSSFELWDFGTSSRTTIIIRNLTTGVDACRYTFTSPAASPLATFVTTLPR